MANLFTRFFSRTTPPVDINRVKPGFRVIGGVLVSEETAMNVSAFYRGVIYISTQLAKLPWHVKDKNNNILTGSVPVMLDLAPNDEMNAFHFRALAIQQAIIHGNFYAEIERDLVGTPTALHPIPTKDVEVVRDVNGRLRYKVKGGSYSSPGSDVYLEPKYMFHLKNLHTKDGLVGQGVVAYATDTLGISLGADRMARGLFSNGGLPSGYIKHKGNISPEAHERMKNSWRESFSGEKAGSVAILEEGTEFESIKVDPQVLQFLDSRKFGVLEIARFLGLPPTKLFDNQSTTFSNVENSNLEVATDTLDAWAVNLEMEADVKILNYRHSGRYTEIDLYSVFRGDMTTRSNYNSKMMQMGATTPNEIRNREGMAPYKEGDRFYIAVNNFTPADRVDEVIDSQIKKNEPAPAKPADPQPNQADTALKQAAAQFLLDSK